MTSRNESEAQVRDDVGTQAEPQPKVPTETSNKESISSPQLQPQPQPQYSQEQAQSQPILSQALKTALFSAKDRMFILSLEQDLISFISSEPDSYLLRPMNSYYRLLTHQTAEYYSIGHSLHNDGSSILVFKNFGVDYNNSPRLLASILYDYSLQIHNLHPQFHAAQFQHQQQFFPPGFIPGSPNIQGGATPYGFISPQQFGFPIPPPGASPHGLHPYPQMSGQFSPNQPYLNGPIPSSHSGAPIQEDGTKDSSVTPITPSSTASQPQFKLMKRSNSEEKNDESSDIASTTTPETRAETAPVQSSTEEISEDPIELESERASRETLYQKARERIFQSEEDDDDEDEDDEEKYGNKETTTSTSPDILRVIPQQHMIPPQFQQQYPTSLPMGIPSPPQGYYYPTMYPQPGAGLSPVPHPSFGNEIPSPPGFIPNQYFYNQGGLPPMQQYRGQPYRKQRNYNTGYRKSHHNGYNVYNNGNYGSYGQQQQQQQKSDDSTGELSNELNGKLRIDEDKK